jgi:hypothetical protein
MMNDELRIESVLEAVIVNFTGLSRYFCRYFPSLP